MAVVWPVAASHCSLEKLPSFGFLACAEDRCCEPQPDTGCQGDACAVVESGFYKVESSRLLVPAPPTAIICLVVATFEISESFAAAQVIPESSPPELSKHWQFSFRTALAPRAPSLAS